MTSGVLDLYTAHRRRLERKGLDEEVAATAAFLVVVRGMKEAEAIAEARVLNGLGEGRGDEQRATD